MSEPMQDVVVVERKAPTLSSQAVRGNGRSRLRWLGCTVLLPIWFLLLLAPCALFYLAANGEIRLWHGNIPQSHAHPLLLVSLISEMDNRGLRIETSHPVTSVSSELSVCVQTDVRFLLWQTKFSNQDVTYCDCYSHGDSDLVWQLDGTYGDYCQSAS